MGTPEINKSKEQIIEAIQADMDDAIVTICDKYPNLPRDFHFIAYTGDKYHVSKVHVRGAGDAKLLPFKHEGFNIFPSETKINDLIVGISEEPETRKIPLIINPGPAGHIQTGGTIVARDEQDSHFHILFNRGNELRSRQIFTITRPQKKVEKPVLDYNKIIK